MASFNRRKPRTKPVPFAQVFRKKAAEKTDTPQPIKRRRGIYLLPNAFTTAALFSGFFAIVQAMNLKFDTAAIAIFVAMVLDGLDGRVARMTNTQSEFGAQYDSLSDMVAFGVAPSLVIYEWSLRGLGKFGWIAAFVYVAGAALRLARFNTNIGVVDKRFFQGLPSPASAALVAGFVWVLDDLRYAGADMAWISWVVAVYAGLTMVSNSPFYSFKEIHPSKRVPFFSLIGLVVVIIAISSDPPKMLFGVFVVYGLSGHVYWVWRQFLRKRGVPVVPVVTANAASVAENTTVALEPAIPEDKTQ